MNRLNLVGNVMRNQSPETEHSMRVGLIGHRDLGDPQSVALVRQAAERHFSEWQATYPQLTVLCSLAIGADTILTEVALQHGCRLIAVLPFARYELEFTPTERPRFHALCARAAEVIELPSLDSNHASFRQAGQWIVDHCDLLLAVWDEQSVCKIGGTSDTVAYATAQRKSLVTIPVTR